ncbi:rod shape-determining protein [Tissierella carlieri]|jgi:rod shape-determining protein MreB|uniref:rod shape-determining protein n=1 Tax=Tissierella TaxID=41273 RepID=UPI000BA0AA74|nr:MULTISPECIES: rod shape-determining protein [Tissierella]MBU5310729.1 rod shape-determining protein [Tissierella carlieri]OZV13424.1 rod shape-determining protein [Tissierella sp. P1]
MCGLRADIGIDLGTASVLVYVKGKGIVLKEPSVVAIDQNTNKFLAVGEEARKMLGRTPGNIIAIRPMRDGVISDYDITERMLKYFIQKAVGRYLLKPRVIVCVPSGITEVEKRAVMEASNQAGAIKTYLIEEPIAAAIGAGIDITEPSGNMIVDIGGGTTDVAIISLGGIVVSRSIKIAGDECDEAISKYIRKKYNMMIGERSAEELKLSIGSAYRREEEEFKEVRGRNLLTGLPITVNVSSTDMLEALKDPIQEIVDTVHIVLERTPPELAADISNKGILMTGGGALLYGMDKLITEKTGISVHVANEPISCVARGTGKALEWVQYLDSNIVEDNTTKKYRG